MNCFKSSPKQMYLFNLTQLVPSPRQFIYFNKIPSEKE